MSQNLDADFLGELQLDYDAWRERLQKICGRYNPEGIERNWFTGWNWPHIEVCGFKALETGCNAGRIERDYRDVRLDYADHYFVLSPLSGQSLVTPERASHTARRRRRRPGESTTRPVKLFSQNNWKRPWRNLAINLPRRELVAHLGFEPQGGRMRPVEPRQPGCCSSSFKA